MKITFEVPQGLAVETVDNLINFEKPYLDALVEFDDKSFTIDVDGNMTISNTVVNEEDEAYIFKLLDEYDNS